MPEDNVMRMVDLTVLIPTVFTKEELKDVKYHFEGNYIIVTHPNHQPYKVRRDNFEYQQFNGIEFE